MSTAGATQPAAMPDGEAPATVDDTAPKEAAPPAEETSLDEARVPVAREPEVPDPGEQVPQAEDFGAEDFGEQDPGAQDLYAQDPGAQDPGAQDPDVEASQYEDGEPPYPDEPYTDEEYDDWDYEKQPLSKLAVAALVSGLLALLPLALVFGIAALAVIRRTGRRGYGMALAGIYAAWIWVLIGAAAAALIYFTHGFSPRVHTEYKASAAYSLRTGDCLNLNNDGSYSIVSCSSSHNAEVYGTLTLAGSTYPGAAAVQRMVVSGCATQLAAYVNPQYADIGFSNEYVYPNQHAWTAGERTVICEASFDSGSISGTIRK